MRVLVYILIISIGCVEEQPASIVSEQAIPSTHPVTLAPSGDIVTGRVLNGVTLEGVEHARVRLSGTLISVITDAEGRYEIPRKEGFHFVEVVMPHFQTSITRLGTETRLWPHEIDETHAWQILKRRGIGVDTDDLNDPDLRAEARAIILESRSVGVEQPRTPPGGETEPVLKQALVPPATIRVYRRGPENNSCQGRVDIIPLEDYVKGVVPHEWIASWADESLRAGSIAARSYGWGWINAGGKYDCADIDDTTRSQVYRDDRTARANAAVDSTRGMAVVENGAVVRSEYSAENGNPTAFGVEEPLCEGEELFGHGRGMCQWGTQRWATQRDKTAEWMVDHYYPNATAGGGTATPTPQIQLRQRLARIDAVSCPSPESMYDCADFVNQSWSNGLFDLFVGARMTLTIEVSNTGQSVANGVRFKVSTDARFLEIDAVVSSGNLSFDNASAEVGLGGIQPGQMVSVEMTLLGVGYSAPTGDAVAVRSWIASIDDGYQKDTWDAAPVDTIDQAFNGGDLRTLFEVDIFDPRRWTWSSGVEEMFEGWVSNAPDGALSVSPSGLSVRTQGTPVLLDSPFLPPSVVSPAEVFFHTDPQQVARLWWRREGEPFVAERTVILGDSATPVSPGDVPSDVSQLRLELSSDTTIRELSLRNEQSMSPQFEDAGLQPVNDASMNQPQPSLDGSPGSIDTDQGFQDPSSMPSRPPARAVRVTHTGGCAIHSGSHWTILCALSFLWILRRRWNPS